MSGCCISYFHRHPETLDFDIDDMTENNNNVAGSIDAVDVATAATAKLNSGLDSFQLVPKDANGNNKYNHLTLFNHLVTFCQSV